jgi:TolB-like protein/tetratricopeptide (TPR) repeat protein
MDAAAESSAKSGGVLAETFRFGRFEVLSGERRLLDAGQRVALGARAFDLLLCLVEQRGRVVPKDELMAQVWPGVVVEENNLTVQVSTLRKLLGSDAISTVPGRGYCFTPAVLDAQAARPMTSADLPAAPATPDIPLSLPGKPSIAVLPFDNLSGDPQQEYFSDGITEDVITELSRFHSLFVIARNSSFTYKGKATDVRAVARDLSVRYVLQGSIRRFGERVRVTAQLIDALSGNHIWAERYDRVLEDIFEVQEELTSAIVAAVNPQIETSEAAKTRGVRPGNLSAYEVAMQAWASAVAFGVDRPARDQALRLAREALAIDPRSALALRTIAWTHCQDLYLGTSVSPETSRSEGLRAASRAVALDNTDQAAYHFKGLFLYLSGDHAAGISDMRRALELNGNDAMLLGSLGFAEALAGDAEKGVRYVTEALRLSPRDPQRFLLMNLMAWAKFAAGDYASALTAAQSSAGENPGFAAPYLCMSVCYAALGDLPRAKTAFGTLRAIAPELAQSRIDGKWMGSDLNYHRRATTFVRIAAGLDDPAAADTFR